VSARESPLLREVILAVSAEAGVFSWRENVGAAQDRATGQVIRFGVPGCSDILAIVAPYGRLLALETKSSKGKQRLAQRIFQAQVERVRGVYALVRTVPEALAALQLARSLPGSST
jgi:hypothetical protein